MKNKHKHTIGARSMAAKTKDDPDFNLYEAAYDGRDWRWYRPLIAECVQHSWPGKILDLGCGHGLLVECGKEYGLDICGIDGSQMAVNIALARNHSLPIWKHDVRERLPFENGMLSAVVCHQVIEHLTRDNGIAMIKECYRVLKPAGALLLYTPSRYNLEQRSDPCHLFLWRPAELREAVRAAGFTIIRVDAGVRSIWPRGRVGNMLARACYRILQIERLATAANVIAVRPSPPPAEYWLQRAEKYGVRAVLHLGHREDEFAAITDRQRGILFPLLRGLLIGNERLVVDYGCGPGRFSVGLAKLTGARVLGLDPVARFLEQAPKDPNVEYKVHLGGDIPLPDECVDVLWVCLVLGGITDGDLPGTVQRLLRKLRPGGLLFLVENTAAKSSCEHWTFRSVHAYQRLFASVPLTHLHDYDDLGERISIMAGRKH